jgi:hypothetical protein
MEEECEELVGWVVYCTPDESCRVIGGCVGNGLLLSISRRSRDWIDPLA